MYIYIHALVIVFFEHDTQVQHVDLTQSLEGSDIVFNDSFDSLDMSPLDEDILDASKQWLKVCITFAYFTITVNVDLIIAQHF